jgi:hypothetical protein
MEKPVKQKTTPYMRWIVGVFSVLIFVFTLIVCWAEKSGGACYKQRDSQREEDRISLLTVDGLEKEQESSQQTNSPAAYSESYLCRLIAPANLPNIYLVLIGIGGVFVALFTLKSIHHQAVQARKQTQYFVSKERARLSVDTRQEESFRFSGIPLEPIADVVVGIEQHGPTKAFNVVGEMKMVIQPSKDPPPMKDMFRMSELPDIVNGNAATIQASTIFVGIITQDLLDKIDSEETFVHLFGVITYTDVFDKKHWTRFRYIWVVTQLDVSPSGEEMPEIVINRGWEKHGPREDNEAI